MTSGKFSEEDEQSFTKNSAVKKPIPLINCPTPQAIFKIEEYLGKHRLRLVDMFARVDRNKDWLISRSECRRVFKKLNVPITDTEIEELISALDSNNDGYLDYRELLKGRLAYKLERRQKKNKVNDDAKEPRVTVRSPQLLSVLDSSSDKDDTTNSTASVDSGETRQRKKEKMKSRQRQHLREAKRPESTRSTRMKQHIAPSTLHEPTAQLVDHYRQEELKQFQNLLVYCKAHGIVLNQPLLERGKYISLSVSSVV